MQVTLAKLRDLTPRLYQETILASCAQRNCLVVLPTGMGKTAIALLLAIQRVSVHPGTKVVFLAPTKPLCDQHLSTFKKHLEAPDESFALFTGEVPPEKRSAQWAEAQFIFSTPQGLENDIIGGRIPLEDVSLFVFDEAHRAVGDYSYVFLAKRYQAKAKFPHLLALTASPGSDMEKIMEVCTNLFVEHVEVRAPEDDDVAPYVQKVDMRPIRVDLPPQMIELKKLLAQTVRARIEQLPDTRLSPSPTRKEVLGAQAEMRSRFCDGERGGDVLKSLSVLAEIMKLQHAQELLESQGLTQLNTYLDKLQEDATAGQSKAVKNLVQDPYVKTVHIKTQRLIEQGVEHPKMQKVSEICAAEIASNPMAKIILFTQYRDTAVRLKEQLQLPGVLPEVFVGQAKKAGTGLSQKKQAEMLAQFTDGMFNVLIATCVAEEGLDIPSVDLVLFYEPVPSAIRNIQRRGRTGRQDDGKVVILITRNTRDEAYAMSARYKERAMVNILRDMRSSLNQKLLQQPQATLSRYESGEKSKVKIAVIVDFREKQSAVARGLVESDMDVRLEMLPCGDYMLSARCGVEFKTQDDFIASILDGRLLEQAKLLRKTYERPIIVVEGNKDIYSLRNVHPNSIRGMMAALAVAFGIPVIMTSDGRETAALLKIIAEREQNEGSSNFSAHNSKPLTPHHQQEYVVGAIPGVGPVLAKELLAKLGSVRGIANADEESLKSVEGVGEKKAKTLTEFFGKDYSPK